MAAVDWDRSASPAWITFDDTSTENLFGDCLSMGSEGLQVLTTVADQDDAEIRCEFYAPISTTQADILIGGRINPANGDGYYVGYASGVSNRPIIAERTSGVLTTLATGFATGFGVAADTIHRIRFRMSGTNLTLVVEISGAPILGITLVDGTHTAAGKASLLRPVVARHVVRAKNFEVRNL